MKFLVFGERGERLFTLAAFALAVASGGFGGLMVVRLERMENPPAIMGLDFSGLQKVTEADPILTGTIAPRRTGAAPSLHSPAPARRPASMDFRLLSVIDGMAFVEVRGPDGKELWPVDVGSTLPGAGRVIAIERDAGHWRLRTTLMTISGEPQ